MSEEQDRFEAWWKSEMGDKMMGSKYLARNAWLAALWTYGVKTRKPPVVTKELMVSFRDDRGVLWTMSLSNLFTLAHLDLSSESKTKPELLTVKELETRFKNISKKLVGSNSRSTT